MIEPKRSHLVISSLSKVCKISHIFCYENLRTDGIYKNKIQNTVVIIYSQKS